jgi:hypothetical protein
LSIESVDHECSSPVELHDLNVRRRESSNGVSRRHLPKGQDAQGSRELWEIRHDGLPNQVEIDLEVAMGKDFPHLMSGSERNLGMRRCEIWEAMSDALAYFSDDLEITDDGVLDESISHEQLVIDVLGVGTDTHNRSKHVLDVVI